MTGPQFRAHAPVWRRPICWISRSWPDSGLFLRDCRHHVANATWLACIANHTVIPAKNHTVIPAKAGTYAAWVPAFAGMTILCGVCYIMPRLQNHRWRVAAWRRKLRKVGLSLKEDFPMGIWSADRRGAARKIETGNRTRQTMVRQREREICSYLRSASTPSLSQDQPWCEPPEVRIPAPWRRSPEGS